MSTKSWRESAREHIEAAAAKVQPGEDLAKAISAAYPFGERAMHPYKVWCEEVAKFLGKHRAKVAAEQDRNASLFQNKQ